jgi:hypothetical protein
MFQFPFNEKFYLHLIISPICLQDVQVRMPLQDHGGIQMGQITLKKATCITKSKYYMPIRIYMIIL